MGHTQSVFQIQINMKLLLVLLPLATAVPIKIISYSATEEKHNHEMEGVPGEAVMGEFSFKAPDTGDAVYKLTYTADMDGFQAMETTCLSRLSWTLYLSRSYRQWWTTPQRLQPPGQSS